MASSDARKPVEDARPEEARAPGTRTSGSGPGSGPDRAPESGPAEAPDATPAPLVRALCDDLSTVLGTLVDPADLHPRHDGAAAPLLGLVGVAAAGPRQVACRLLAEWVRAGTVEAGEQPELWGPSAVDVATLRLGGERLLPGLTLTPLPSGLPPREAVERLLPTVAELLGAMRQVALVDHTRATTVPGWSARLRLLAECDALGPAAAATGDPGAWVVAAHHLAASAFVPEAAEGSVWTQLMAAVRTHAVRALAELGEAREGEGELDRRGSHDFTALVDMERSVTLDDHPARSGNVLQVVRLPRERAGRMEKALVLLAPRSGG
ncbi:hypothetical protein [Streptomyces flavofungini]|uniref:hypothetical protein n=1 Tax=Streptomyces flavofungini TaxID=68200 RepID=UPI0025AEF088|nr:hypothetical protein [Streptomyces flavofungini]WJV50562.1 hypothetical protein QUY26_36725 [Streptomyces flavofungini]